MTGEKLRQKRKEANLSQCCMAKAMGMSASALSQAESGKTSLTMEHELVFLVRIKTLKRISDELRPLGMRIV